MHLKDNALKRNKVCQPFCCIVQFYVILAEPCRLRWAKNGTFTHIGGSQVP